MRTPVIAVSLIGAAILSPTFAAPTSRPIHRNSDSRNNHHQLLEGDAQGASLLASRGLSGRGLGHMISDRDLAPTRFSSSSWSVTPREFWKKVDPVANLKKRLSDAQTMGGNAHSGNSGAVNGGSVFNTDTTNNEGMPVLMNVNSNNAGLGGQSTTGCAASGKGSKVGIGGNASSGNSGKAEGGNVTGPPSGMVNMNSNNAGTAGESTTGCATGGDTFNTEAEDSPITEEELNTIGEGEGHLPFSNA